jgi:hypothetical protein
VVGSACSPSPSWRTSSARRLASTAAVSRTSGSTSRIPCPACAFQPFATWVAVGSVAGRRSRTCGGRDRRRALAGRCERHGERHRRPVRQRVDERRRGHACLAPQPGGEGAPGATLEDGVGDVAVGEGGAGRAVRGAGQQQGDVAVHRRDGRCPEVDAPDRGHPLGAVGPQRDGDRHRHRRRVLDLDDEELSSAVPPGGADGVGPVEDVTARHPHGRLHHRGVGDEALAHGRLARREVPPVLGTHPPVERPAAGPRRDEAPRVHRRLVGGAHVAHDRPAAGRDVLEERQRTAGDEGGGGGVELALEPVRPHPAGAGPHGAGGPQRAAHGGGVGHRGQVGDPTVPGATGTAGACARTVGSPDAAPRRRPTCHGVEPYGRSTRTPHARHR